jgi:segregation and condensation protein A
MNTLTTDLINQSIHEIEANTNFSPSISVISSVPDIAINIAKLYGEPFKVMPKDLYIPPDALEVFLESFEGPLDLLLYLIRKQGLNILDIPMALLTEQYLSYVEEIRHTQFELAADYLLMAAMLIEIKTRMLLPSIKNDDAEEEDDPRAELIRKLISYEAIKKASYALQELPVCYQDFYLTHVLQEKTPAALVQIDINEIVQVFQDLLKKQNLFEHHQIMREQLSVREYMSKTLKYLQAYQHDVNKITLVNLLNYQLNEHNNHINNINHISSTLNTANNNKQDITYFGISNLVVYFLAILELVKEGLILFTQNQAFGDIYLELSYHAN